MPFRLRLFVKKRGTRRTGSRWQAAVAVAALDAGMMAIGLFGIYWVATRYLLRDETDFGWWPWLVIVIPAALVVYGATGVAAVLWQNIASTERRAAAVRKATTWELPGTDLKPAYAALPTVPPIDPVVESPGVRLAYRLPIDAASGWVSATMAAVCIVWGILAVVGAVQILGEQVAGQPTWLLTLLMAALALASVWILAASVRQILRQIAVGTTRLEVSDHPFYPGRTYRGFVSQAGRLHVRWFQVQLVCQEQAIYQQGTDTRVATARVYRGVEFRRRKFDVTPGQAFETDFQFTIPASAMHSFVAGYNAVNWALVVRGRTRTWGDFERRFPIFVYPNR